MIKYFIFPLLLLSLFLFCPFQSIASSFGTNAAEFLTINPEAGPAGMGEAYIAIAEGTNALQYNPGGLAIMDRGEATATSIIWFDNINMIHVAAGYPIADGFGMAASVLWINYGSFDSTGGVQPSVSMQDGLINFGAAKSFGDNINVGIGLRGLYESFSAGTINSSSLGLSADAGAVFLLGSRNLTLGLTASNMGVLFGTNDPLPAEVGAGLGWRLFNGSFNYMNMDLDVRKIINADNYYVGLGFEGYIFRTVALRFGIHYNNALENNSLGLSNIQDLIIFSAGAGVNINDSFGLDYSFTPMGDLGEVQRLTLKIKFGDSWYEKRMAETNAKIEPKAIEAPEVSVSDGEIKGVSFKPNVPQENVKEWSLAIKTSDGKIVKTFSGVGEVPKTLNWDGTDAYGRISKSDVNYVFDFKAKNSEGQIIKTIGQIGQPKQAEPVPVAEEDKRFIPIKGEEMLVAPMTLLVSADAEERKSVPFVMVNKKIKQVKDWEFAIYDGNKTLLKKFTGQGMIPSYLVWDGKDSFENYVQDLKKCQYVLTVNGTDGKRAEIRDRQIMRDPFVISTKTKKIKLAKMIFFEKNASVITADMSARLDELSVEIASYKNLQIYIQGHSSAEGDSDYNLRISQERAKSVLRYLVEKHKLSPLSITTVGYGASIPIENENTEQGRMRNRRVEIIMIGEKE
jgi:outer membrane protein OmpA-like peptidoglycan-associated protein